MKKLNSIGSVIVNDQIHPQFRNGTPDLSFGVYLGDVHIEDLDGISDEDKAVLEDAIKKESTQVYAIVYKSDFYPTSDDDKNYELLSEALFNLRHSEDKDDLVIVRAPDSESDFDHVLEGNTFIKYA